MANCRAVLKQAELTRYLRAWLAAGLPMPRVEIRPDGTAIILPTEDKTGDSENDWD